MSAHVSIMPFAVECEHLAAMLEGGARELSVLHDVRLEGLLPCPWKAELVRAALPDRHLIFEAQQAAYALRLGRPVEDSWGDLPHTFAGNIKCRRVDGPGRAIIAARADIDKALSILTRLFDARERAMICDD